MNDTSPDRRSLSTKKWVATQEEIREAKELDDARVASEHALKDDLAQQGYYNPKGVWIGLAIAIALIVAGWWVFDTMRCDPFESDIALSRGGACR